MVQEFSPPKSSRIFCSKSIVVPTALTASICLPPDTTKELPLYVLCVACVTATRWEYDIMRSNNACSAIKNRTRTNSTIENKTSTWIWAVRQSFGSWSPQRKNAQFAALSPPMADNKISVATTP